MVIGNLLEHSLGHEGFSVLAKEYVDLIGFIESGLGLKEGVRN